MEREGVTGRPPVRVFEQQAGPTESNPSPYRRLVRPLVEYVNRLKEEHPDRLIAVIIPELVEMRWYEYLLHNHRAKWLKADLMLQEDQRIVVINLPWYLS